MVAALSAFLLPFVGFDRGALKTIGTKSKLAKIENKWRADVEGSEGVHSAAPIDSFCLSPPI